jgi:hypothetical protein
MSVYIRYAGTISFLHSPYCPFLFRIPLSMVGPRRVRISIQ